MAENNPRILIVEDSVRVSDLISRILEDMGYKNIRIATTGKDAVIEAKAKKPDLVLLDLGLPDIHSGEVLRRIKSIDKNIPVIIVTAYPYSMEAKEIQGQEIADFITKPFDINDFKKRITKVLARNLKD